MFLPPTLDQSPPPLSSAAEETAPGVACLAVLADVHGNLPALEAVLADARAHGAEMLVAAGDLTGGPQAQEVLDRLRALGALLIRGNNEDYLLAHERGEFPASWWQSRQWTSMRWFHGLLAAETLAFLATVPDQAVLRVDGAAPVRVVHGSPRSNREHLIPDGAPAALVRFRRGGVLPAGGDPPPLALALAAVPEPVLVCGHSHVAWQQQVPGCLAFNPGSAGATLDGDARARYALLIRHGEQWHLELRAVDYDLAAARAAFFDRGLLAKGGAFAYACLMGNETGENVPGGLVAHAFRLARETGWQGHGAVPDAIWEQAVATYNWAAYGPPPVGLA